MPAQNHIELREGQTANDIRLEEVVRDFALCDQLPAKSIAWSLENWGFAGHAFCELLAITSARVEESPSWDSVLFYIVQLLAEKCETGAYRPLCELIRRPGWAPRVLDEVAAYLHGILISVFDGDAAPLLEVIDDPESEDYGRSGALDALTYLYAVGRIPDFDMRSYLLYVHSTLRNDADLINSSWVGAVANLGLADLKHLALAELDRMHLTLMTPAEFEEELSAGMHLDTRLVLFQEQCIGPFGSVVEMLGKLYGHPDETWKQVARENLVPGEDNEYPASNTLRDIGRNDPCPCGSGKKFKKCCMRGDSV